jgi:hypothetical protein
MFPTLKSSNGMPKFLTMRDCRETQWYYKYQPYLGFTPRDDVFEGPIFGRFHGNRSYFETKVKGQGLMYIFDPGLAQSWIRVENALLALITLFFVRLQPLTAPRDSYPSDTKFYEPKPTVKKVVDSVLFAQKLHLQLIAELRYSIAMSSELQDGNWVAAIQRMPIAAEIDHSWLADLAASKAMTTKRLAGMVLDPFDMEKGYQVQRFAHFHVPVSIPFAIIHRKIRLPVIPNQPVAHESEVRFKTLVDVQQLKHLWLPFDLPTVTQRIRLEWDTHYRSLLLNIPYVPSAQPHHTSPEPLPTVSVSESPLPHPSPYDDSPLSPPSRDADDELPEPYSNSGQQAGEWWYDHHHLVRLTQELGDDDETPREQKTREANEKLAEKIRVQDQLPRDFKHSVFVWEPTDVHPTFLLRRRLSVQEIRNIWPSIPPSNKIYNSYDYEWDLYDISCDMEKRTRRLMPDNDPTEQDVELTNSTHLKPKPMCTQDDLKLTLQGKIDDAITSRMPLFCEEDPLGTATRRFGFVFPNPPLIPHVTKKKDQVQWFYHLGYKDVMLPQETAAQVEQILFCLKKNHLDHLRNLLDIYTNPQGIMENNTVIIRHFPSAKFDYSYIRQRNLYILSFPGDNRKDWFLGLSQASDLVFAMREGWATSRESLVDAFLVYGIQFYTLAPVPGHTESRYFAKAPPIPTSSQQRALFPDASFTIPLEPETMTYTGTDFFEYEKRREHLLDSPCGRIAARSGGVVARLWRRDTSKYHQRKKQVMIGPTDLALWKGIRVHCGLDEEFYDDEMLETVDAYISGQYRARKG